MINFLHTYAPSPILAQIGPVSIYWYGLCYGVAIVLGYWIVARQSSMRRHPRACPGDPENATTLFLDSHPEAENDESNKVLRLREDLPNLILAVVIVALVGAHLYDILLEPTAYITDPSLIFKIWQGGFAFHGALIAGGLYLWWYARKHRYSLLWLFDLAAPALLIGQAIGRFGNYFNQELFGYPTNLPWGIPIDLAHRPLHYLGNTYFHPVFLYESLLYLFGFIALVFIQRRKPAKASLSAEALAKEEAKVGLLFCLYLIIIGTGRLVAEYFRIDEPTLILNFTLSQVVSVFLIGCGIIGVLFLHKRKNQL